MRYFSALMAGLVLAACGGETGEYRDTCHPDPSEVRAVVPVTVRNDADNTDIEIERLGELLGSEWGHDEEWVIRYSIENEPPRLLTPGTRFGADTRTEVTIDTVRGHRASFTGIVDGIINDFSIFVGPDPILTVTLDRSCELVIVVSDERDGDNLTLHLSHFWR